MKGTIDQLNFEVILHDEKFTAKVNKDINLAKSLNTSLSNILSNKKPRQIISDKGVSNAQQMALYLDQIWKKLSTMPKGNFNFMVGDADKLNATLSQTNQRLDQIIAKSKEAGKQGGSAAGSLSRAWLRFTATMWSIIAVLRIFVNAIGSVAKKIASFQQANANLATIMQVSRREIKVLTEDALMLGRTTEWTASQVTELQTALAKLGYNIPQIRNMQASVLQFATAVGANLPDAANLAGASLRMFGLHSTEMQKTLEILTASTNKTALDFEKLKVALPYVGAIANSIGFDVSNTSALLGVLANSGLAASRTGTGLRKVLLELSKENGKLQTAMGGNIKSFDDFVNGLQLLRDRGLEAGEAQKLVGDRAGAALLILANGVDDIKRLNDEVKNTDGLLKNIQADRLNTLHGSTLLLKSAWEGLIQTFRDSAGPMKNIVDWLTKIVRATSLAASRANRVAQGTKNVIGSDDLTKQFKAQYEGIINNLVAGGMNPVDAAAEAAKTVNKAMQMWMDKAVAANTNPDIEEKGWYKFLTNSVPLAKWITKGVTRKGRAADEQVSAIENAMVSVLDYMANSAKEEGEIAANNYLEEWRMVFDTQGEKAVREAMEKVSGYENIKSQIEAYIANNGEEGANDRGKAPKIKENPFADAISDARTAVSVLEKYKDAYDKLAPLLGEDAAKKWVSDEYGYNIDKFEEDILGKIKELKEMGPEGEEAASVIESRLGLDKASRLAKRVKEAKKAIEDYEKALSKFDKDWGTGATGVAGKAEKALRDYNNEDKKITDEYIDAANKAYKAFAGDNEKINREINKLKTRFFERKTANRAKFDDSINNLADDIFKDAMKGFDLSNWNDKTYAQIQAIREALKAVKVPDSIREMLEKTPEGKTALDNLDKDLQQLVDDMNANTVDPEWWKKVGKEIRKVAGDFSGVADAAVEYGEVIGEDWGKALDTMKEMGETLSVMAERWVKEDWIGVASAGLSFLIKKLIEAATETKRFEKQLAELQEQARHASVINSISNIGESIFGTNDLEKLRLGMEGVNDALERMNKLAGNGFYGKVSWGTGKWFIDLLSRINGDGAAGSGSQWFSDVSSALSRYKLPVYDENGILNRNSLEALKELVPDNESNIQKLINTIDEYYAAVEKVEGAMSELIGDIADDAASKLIDQWIEAGNAALDYADILDDVARSYANMVLKDMIMQAMPEDLAKNLAAFAVSGDNERFMSELASAMEGISNMEPYFQQVLQAFDPYFNKEDESKAGSVGKGIQSITEDTANLLASYINGIRADVAGMRAQDSIGWDKVTIISEYVPTLNDWLSKIQADTANIADYNSQILENINSMMDNGSEGSALRVLVD